MSIMWSSAVSNLRPLSRSIDAIASDFSVGQFTRLSEKTLNGK